MKAPTEAQLKDPKWWDENAPEGATHFARFPSGEFEWQKRLPNKVTQHWDERAQLWDDVGPYSSATMTLRPTKTAAPEWPAMPDRFYEGLGWMHAECCAALDAGEDPRRFEIGEMVQRCIRDLTKEQRERDETIAAAIRACPYPGSETTKVDIEALYDAGMLRKAGDK